MFRNSVSTQKNAYRALTAASTIAHTESGKVFGLPAGGFATTLPPLSQAAGFKATFLVEASTTGASHTIIQNSSDSTNCVLGHVVTVDVDSGTNPDFAAGTAADTITVVVSKAVLGDRVDVFCNGTNWFVTAYCSVFDAITLDVAS